MRRKDREITDRAEMESVLVAALVCHVALADGMEPYVVPLCFAYVAPDNAIYFHSSLVGKKTCNACEEPPLLCGSGPLRRPHSRQKPLHWEFRYRSVICTGTAHMLTDPQEKNRALNCIIRHYGEKDHHFTEKELDRVCVVKIAIGEMTGKKHGY